MRCGLIGGGEIETGEKLGEGGEGVVHAAKDGRRAVKLYHTPLNGAEAAKLRAMLGRDIGDLAAQAAWPEALVAGPHGSVAGFVMAKADEPFDIHAIYSPRDRREKLPAADWRFLVRVATNLAAAFHAAHAAGIVIGDVNHGSVRVGRDARVRLIDCDSFQIAHGGAVLRCAVGVDAYTPPELQGRRLADIDRTPDHDRFGLAVLIFQLLFMGRHPYSGVPRTAGAPTEIPAAIAARAYAYAGGKSVLGPPPAAPPIGLVTADIAAMFERAFTGAGKRPAAAEWFAALGAFGKTLSACGASSRHVRGAHLAACPWCAFEAAGVDFFPAPQKPVAALDLARFDEREFEAAWRRLEAAQKQAASLAGQLAAASPTVRLPVDVDTRLERARRTPPAASPRSRLCGRLRRALGVISLLVVLGAFLLQGVDMAVVAFIGAAGLQLLAGVSYFNRRDRANRALDALQDACKAREREVLALADAAATAGPAAQIREQGRHLAEQIRKLRKRLHDAPREQQLHAWLDRFPLTASSVSGIGPARIAQLASFGIESAADIDEDAILTIPGFGPEFATRLCRWRDKIASRFRYNSEQAGSGAWMQRLQRELAAPLGRYRETLKRLTALADAAERSIPAIEQKKAEAAVELEALIAAVVSMEAEARGAALFGR